MEGYHIWKELLLQNLQSGYWTVRSPEGVECTANAGGRCRRRSTCPYGVLGIQGDESSTPFRSRAKSRATCQVSNGHVRSRLHRLPRGGAHVGEDVSWTRASRHSSRGTEKHDDIIPRIYSSQVSTFNSSIQKHKHEASIFVFNIRNFRFFILMKKGWYNLFKIYLS